MDIIVICQVCKLWGRLIDPKVSFDTTGKPVFVVNIPQHENCVKPEKPSDINIGTYIMPLCNSCGDNFPPEDFCDEGKSCMTCCDHDDED